MIIGIHPDKTKSDSYSEKWIKFLNERKVATKEINLLANDWIEQIKGIDGIMWRWLHNPDHQQSAKWILYNIEKTIGIPVYPDFNTSWHFDNKIAQFLLLKSKNYPTPKSWIFWDKKSALEWIPSTSYPVIFKLSTGAGSSNVIKIESEREAQKIVSKIFNKGMFSYSFHEYKNKYYKHKPLFSKKHILNSIRYYFFGEFPSLPTTWWKPEKNYAYFQEFLPENEFDTRITVIGDQAFGFRRFNRSEDFRASGSGIIDYNTSAIDTRCIELALKISNELMFQSMAYDFLYDKNRNPVICEISYGFNDTAVYNCPGHWDRNLNWKEKQIWPEEIQVMNFINSIRKLK